MNTEEDGWQRFLKLCLKAKGPKELNALLEALLTHTERHEIAFRALIFQELLRGEKPQREIAKELSISIAKVTRGSNVLKTIGPDLRKILEN